MTLAVWFCASTLHASALPQHRFIFEFPETAGTIRKMQVDLTETKGKWIARTKSLAATGTAQAAELPCDKITKDEFKCMRDDNGGGFDLTLAPTPKITVTFFSADEEDADTKVALRAPKTGPLTVEGKKSALSTKDAF